VTLVPVPVRRPLRAGVPGAKPGAAGQDLTCGPSKVCRPGAPDAAALSGYALERLARTPAERSERASARDAAAAQHCRASLALAPRAAAARERIFPGENAQSDTAARCRRCAALKMGLFDGLTKGMEAMIGAEEATGINVAPRVPAAEVPLTWTVGISEVADPRHPMEDAWFAGDADYGLYLSRYLTLCARAYVHAWLQCVRVCVCVCVSLALSLYGVWVDACAIIIPAAASPQIHLCACVCVFLVLSLSLSVCMCVCRPCPLSFYICVHVSVSVCMCLCLPCPLSLYLCACVCVVLVLSLPTAC